MVCSREWLQDVSGREPSAPPPKLHSPIANRSRARNDQCQIDRRLYRSAFGEELTTGNRPDLARSRIRPAERHITRGKVDARTGVTCRTTTGFTVSLVLHQLTLDHELNRVRRATISPRHIERTERGIFDRP